jgi:hypothetical protein
VRAANNAAASRETGIYVGGGAHKRYHTPKDSFENIDKKFYVSAAETAWLILQAADSQTVN